MDAFDKSNKFAMTRKRRMKSSYTTRIVMAAIIAIAYITTAHAPIAGGALEYMLQRPRVAKQWQERKAFDHLFFDGGVGANLMGASNLKWDMGGTLNIGDWITPEHGVRLNLTTGEWNTQGVKSKYATFGLDYLLNITAIAQRGRYYTPKRFEVYGIAGAAYAMTYGRGTNSHGIDIHIGLRGQLALSRNVYAYLEPRFGLIEDQISGVNYWRGYRPFTTISMGLGYRLPATHRHYADPYRNKHSFLDGIFVSGLVGATFLSNAHDASWGDYAGVRPMASVGKWFDAYNAVRLSLSAVTMRPTDQKRTKALSSQVEYMLNLSNALAGVDPERSFWINLLGGVSFNRSGNQDAEIRSSWGVGVGLQGNVRLSRGLSFVVEPRVDIYNKNFIQQNGHFKPYNVMPSLLTGFVYTYHDRYAIERHAEGINGQRKASFSIAGGLASSSTKMKNTDYWMPTVRLSYTQWSRSANGLRFSLDGTMRRRTDEGRYAKAVADFDWLADLTAMNYGTEHERWLSLRTVVGFGIGADYGEQKAYFASDVHAGGQARIRLSSTTGLFVEPTMAYELSDRFKGRNWGRVTPRVLVGLDYALNREKHTSELNETPSEKNFVDVSGGIGYYSGNFSEMTGAKKLTYDVRAGYGRWLNGVHGVYGSVRETFAKRAAGRSDHTTVVAIDYMMNIRNAISGEQNDDKVFQLTGLMGAQLGICSGDGHDTKVAPGVNAALQAGFRASRHIEIYLEPSATVYTKTIEPYKGNQPANGELKLSLGLKYHF